MTFTRRHIMALLAAVPFQSLPTQSTAQSSDIWSATDSYAALSKGDIRMLDIRTPPEWAETGVAKGAWPVNLHDRSFGKRLFAAQELAQGRPVALICATGGRTGGVLGYLRQSAFAGFIDVSEGMMGSPAGPGWIKLGLPIVPAAEALAALPDVLRA